MAQSDLLLWRRLTETDFKAINGEAAPSNTGGGAMHIALGKDRESLPIRLFLKGNLNGHVATISTQPSAPNIPQSALTFDGNPGRRSGEWRIADQFSNRHPAWSPTIGFPSSYNQNDRPIAFVIRQGNDFHARFSTEKKLRSEIPSLALHIDKNTKTSTGILPFDPSWGPGLNITAQVDNLDAYAKLAKSVEGETLSTFDPKNIADGRKKTLAEVVRRQGQSSFRKKLLAAYEGRCAISGSPIEVVLEAAHITPYRGPETNHPSNGILLRADLHTLFDLGLITIDSNQVTVIISSKLNKTEYAQFSGAKVFIPKEAALRPSTAALKEHNASLQD